MPTSGEQQKRDEENDSHARVNYPTDHEAHDPARKDEVLGDQASSHEACSRKARRRRPCLAGNRASESYLAVVPGCFSM